MSEPPPLFHGTRRGFRAGGLLLPRSAHGGAPTSAPGGQAPPGAAGYVYATEHLDLAWAYAFHAPGRGRPKVLRVGPLGPVTPDPEHSAAMAAWRCEAARVLEVLLTPTLTEAEAREGWQR